MIAYLLWRLATLIAGPLPSRAAYQGAAAMADLVYCCWPAKRSNTIANMRHVLGTERESYAATVARRSWRNYGRYLVDFIRSSPAEVQNLARKVEFGRWAEIDSAFADGRGIIFALMHFGSWDVGGAIFAARHPLNVIADTFTDPRLNQMIVQSRTTAGMRVIPMEKAGLRVVRALRRNEAVAILMDRPGVENGVRASFFGSEVMIPSGVARLALRTNARVIAAAVARDYEADRLIGWIGPDIEVRSTGDEDADIRTLTESILRAHEEIIRQYPDQWYMFRRMWPEERRAELA
jgi:Kdo2-lipid IVA lauroyltransferase/acyltransferase